MVINFWHKGQIFYLAIMMIKIIRVGAFPISAIKVATSTVAFRCR